MSARERKPSAKARELATGYLGDYVLPSSSKKPKSSKPSSSKSKRVYSQYDDEDEDWTSEQNEPVLSTEVVTTNDFDIPKAYCICLGDDDNTPMIQCEGCENWFHFRCIDLHEDEAKRVKAYYCENCTLAGLGQTKYFGQGGTPSPQPEDKDDGAYDSVNEPSPSPSEIDDDENAPLRPFASSKKRASGGGSKRPKKRAKAEGTSDEDEDEDGTYLGDGDPVVDYQYHDKAPKKKASAHRSAADKRHKLEALADKRRGYTGVRLTTDPAAARTRHGVKSQLNKTLADIYLTGEPRSGRLKVEAIEQELFDLTAEPDHTGGLAPKNKYTTKFRSLWQNLKSNAYLRSRLAGLSEEEAITAHSLVNMAPEDLLTPEQRALAQQVQEKSMRDSIKAAIEAPKAKVTHKGEEVIDEMATTDERVDLRNRQSSFAGSPIPAGSPTAQSPPSFFASSPRERETSFNAQPDHAFSPRDETLMGPPPLPRMDSGPIMTQDEMDADALIDSPTEEFKSFSAPAPSASPTTRASFDLNSIWGTFKAPAPDQSPPPGDEKEKEADDMDVADSPTEVKEDQPAPASKEVAVAPKPVAPSETSAPPNGQLPIERLAPIWDGNIEVPEECTFPAFAVQVAGRLLGTNREYWHRIIPPAHARIEGRLATHVAAEYLVQNTFSASRELVVLALLPDLSGPAANKLPPERAQSEYTAYIKSLAERKRAAVILPQERQKKAVKDLYLLPLLRTDPVPDFVELLEAHALGEGKERERDYLLLIAVLQKGMLPPPIFDAHLPPPASTALPGPGGFSAAPPSAMNALAGIDPATIQALLAQPQLLQTLMAQTPPQQPASMSPAPPQQQVNNLLSGLDPSVLSAMLRHPPPNAGAASPPQPQHQQQQPAPRVQSPSTVPLGMSMNPARAQMLAGGSHGPPQQQHFGGHHRGPSNEYRRGRGGGYR